MGIKIAWFIIGVALAIDVIIFMAMVTLAMVLLIGGIQ